MLATAAAAFVARAAAGCASFDGAGLVPGKSLEAEVVALMGTPSRRSALPKGEAALYFSRLPEGRAMFVVTVGPDGVMKSIEQRLVRKNIALIAANTSKKEEVLDLFGPPGRTGRLPLMPREWWEYKYYDYAERRIVWVQFSDDGVVREVIDMRDWDHERPRWPSWRRN
ncbi:MAG: hypothetical protein ACREIB_10535 [Pseudomonadota bacterium]